MIQLLEELEKNNVSITLNDNELEVSFDGTIDPSLIERLKEHKDRIVSFLKKYPSQQKGDVIERASAEESYPLSNAQKRLWILCRDEAHSITYNLVNSILLNGDYDPDIFAKAVYAVVTRHEILRTVFEENDLSEVCQRVVDPEHNSFRIGCMDYSMAADSTAEARAYMDKDMMQAFDLTTGPLIRAALLRLGKSSYIFYYNIHHIISDGWSMEVLGRDTMAYYKALIEGREVTLPELKIQYKDYAIWQRHRLKEGITTGREYWSRQLAGTIPRLEYPAGKPRPRVKTYQGHNLEATIPAALTGSLNSFCREESGSLFMILMALWKVLTFRYTAQHDIVIGTATAGRDHQDLEDQIGFYVNTLAIRSQVDPAESFRDFFRKEKQQVLSALTYQSYPFDQIVEDLGLEYSNSRSPVFDVMLVLQNETDKTSHTAGNAMPGGAISDGGQAPAMFDITINFQEHGNVLFFQLNYNTDLYEERSMRRLMLHYQQLAVAVVSGPDMRISDLEYMPDEEKAQLIYGFNNTETHYPREAGLVDLFEEQVSLHGDRTAVIFEETELSYTALNRHSDALAAYIQLYYGISPGQFIGICLDRSHWLPLAVLAVLKCGCAYVPIDPRYPVQRVQYMEEDSGCQLIIDRDMLDMFEQEDTSRYAGMYRKVPVTATDLAYLMYTSGSTGSPKGVMVEQRSVVRLVKDTMYYRFDDLTVLLSTGSFSFDATTFEFWGPLLHGGQLVLCTHDVLLDAGLLSGEIIKRGVNVMWFTSGWLNQLVDANIGLFSALQTVLVGGDRLSPVHINRLRQAYPDLRLINGYGPTENTTFSLAYNIEKEYADIPLGYPISNSTAYVLDAAMKLVPIGVAGEICLGGDGLARGYHNQPELTDEKFVVDPFHTGNRLYRTGDLGKWDEEGRLLFLGRVDNQVKIRGHRVEPGEVEAQLLAVEGVRNGVAVIREMEEQPAIVIYFEPEGTAVTRSLLRKALQERLPGYMLPEYYVPVNSIPLNANGKVDRDALPPVTREDSAAEVYIAPRNIIEQQVTELWQEVLGCRRVGINDDFFALGGHSLKAMRLLGIYQQRFSKRLQMKELFEHLTPEAHAALILSKRAEAEDSIPALPEALCYSLSPAQRRLWIVAQSAAQSSAYNMPSLSYIHDEQFDIVKFRKAIDTVIRRHEILRTVFREAADGTVMQWVLSPEAIGFNVAYRDFRHDAQAEDMALAFIEDDAYKVFDLAAGPLLRAFLLQYSDSSYIFYYNMHHIVSDGSSMQLLAEEVLTGYKAYCKGEEPVLPVLTIQYKDYSAWQLSLVSTDLFKASEAYWMQQFREVAPELRLSIARGKPVTRVRNSGWSVRVELRHDTFQKLEAYAARSGTTMYMNFMSLLGLLLYRYSYRQDLVIGSPVSGRSRDELKHQIGLYVNTVAISIQLLKQQSYAALLETVKQKVLDADLHKEYPYDLLVQRLRSVTGSQTAGLFNVMLILNHYDEEAPLADDPEVCRFEEAKHKFDLSFYFNVFRNKIEIEINYDAVLFDDSSITVMTRDFIALTELVLDDDTISIGESCKKIRNKESQEEHTAFSVKLNSALDEDF